jgi:hypothetical protein
MSLFTYQVTAAFRVNVNRPDRREIVLTVRALSKESALFLAGWKLRLDLDSRTEGVVPESLSLSARRIPRHVTFSRGEG